MTDYQKLSRLPDDERYWDGLEARIMTELGPRVRPRADQPAMLWASLEKRAWSLSGLAAAAGLAALLFAPERSVRSDTSPAGLLRLPEDDPMVQAFVSASEPPPLASLVIPRSGKDQDD